MKAPCVVAVVLALLPVTARAQSVPQAPAQESLVRVATRRAVPENVITADPGALLFGQVSVQYERALTSFVSLVTGLRGQYGLATFGWIGSPGSQQSARYGGGADLGVRFYFQGFAPQGFYLGVEGAAMWMHVESQPSLWPPTSVQRSLAGGQVGVHLGHQWIVSRAFALALGAGLTLPIFDGVEGFALALRVGLGVAL